MVEINEANAMDEILNLCLKSEYPISPLTIKKDVFPSKTIVEIIDLIAAIEHHNSEIADINIQPDCESIGANNLTKNFITGGGFSQVLKDAEEAEVHDQEHKTAQLENLRTSTEVNQHLLKTKWWPHIMSAIAVILSIISIVLQFYK